jgi:mannose-6-phosphate isomerase-like protein (cupin superfamily)
LHFFESGKKQKKNIHSYIVKMFHINIEKETIKNTFYRKVLFTTPQMQLVVMSIPKGENIPKEKHIGITQFIRVEKGNGKVIINNCEKKIKDGDAIIIPPNTFHFIANTGNYPLKIYVLYSPPEHPKNSQQKKRHKK